MEELEVKIEQEIISINESALSLQVINAETYAVAGEMLKSHKEMEKHIKTYFESLKKPAHAAWKTVCDRENEELDKLKPASTHLNKQMTDWYVAEEKKRKAEEERLRQEAFKREEEERLAAAIELEKEGYKEEARAIIEEPVYVPPPIVERVQPKVAGLAIAENWLWEIEDFSKVPREYLKLDEVKINAAVRTMKSATKIPGIRVYPESKMRGVRK